MITLDIYHSWFRPQLWTILEPQSGRSWTSKVFNIVITLDTYHFYILEKIPTYTIIRNCMLILFGVIFLPARLFGHYDYSAQQSILLILIEDPLSHLGTLRKLPHEKLTNIYRVVSLRYFLQEVCWIFKKQIVGVLTQVLKARKYHPLRNRVFSLRYLGLKEVYFKLP